MIYCHCRFCDAPDSRLQCTGPVNPLAAAAGASVCPICDDPPEPEISDFDAYVSAAQVAYARGSGHLLAD